MKRFLKVPRAGTSPYGDSWTKELVAVYPERTGGEAFVGPGSVPSRQAGPGAELPVGEGAEVDVGALLLGFAENREPGGSLRWIDLALWRVPADVPLVPLSTWRIHGRAWPSWPRLVGADLIAALKEDPIRQLSQTGRTLARQLSLLPPLVRADVITAAAWWADEDEAGEPA
jgi:hypothetical protein